MLRYGRILNLCTVRAAQRKYVRYARKVQADLSHRVQAVQQHEVVFLFVLFWTKIMSVIEVLFRNPLCSVF